MSATAARWSEVRRLFDEAWALSPELRTALLDRACTGDETLRAELDGLIGAAAASGDFLETKNPARGAPVTAPALPAGSRVGAYRIEGLIGRGGMGEVYRAQRADGQYAQQVAIKLLSQQLAQKPDYFVAERQILAQLEHPRITHLLDGGLAEDGRPYMVMEYIEGRNFLDYCRDRKCGLRERLGLFLQVCEAVAYAHRHLVVHRDLKPSNILVTAEGQVKLLDFGIAKLVGPAAGAGTGLGGDATRTLQLTPSYAAPEQLQGGPVTTATDTYSLGVLLFELLAGEPPFKLAKLPLAVAVQHVLHQPSPLPSAAAERTDAPIPAAALRGDLDAITGKALRKEPEARYPAAAELQADLERHLRHEPVGAREAAFGYVLRRFARRHRIAVASGIAALTALVIGLGVSLWFYAQAQQALVQATQSAATTLAVSEFLNKDVFASIDRDQAPVGHMTVKELLDRAAAAVNQRFPGQAEAEAQVHYSLAFAYESLGLLQAAEFHARQANILFTRLHGPDSPAAVDALELRLDAESHAHDWPGAIRAITDVRDHRLRQFGEDHPRVLKLRNQLALVHYLRGDYRQAEAELRVVQTVVDRMPPGTERGRSSPRWILGALLRDKGDFKEAEAVQRADVADRAQRLGEHHYMTASARYNLGRVLTRLGRYDEAEAAIQQATVDYRAWLGDQHPSSIYHTWAMGELRLAQGRVTEAVKLLDDAYRRNVGQFGREDQDGAWLSSLLAEAYWRQGKLDRALSTIQDSIVVGDKLQGATHPKSIEARIRQAGIQRQRREFDQAWLTLGAIPQEGLKALPERHPMLGDLRREEGLLWLAQKQHDKARLALNESLAIHQFRHGDSHWRTQRVRRDLAAVP